MIQRFRCNACKGEYSDVQPDGSIYHHACPPLNPNKKGETPERENKRDENVDRLRRGTGSRVAGIISEGEGVKCLTDDKLTEPPWITRLKAQVEKEYE